MRMDTETSASSGKPGPSPTSPGDRSGPRRFDVGTERIAARVAQTKERIDASRVGHVQRRFVQADLANQAMILAALALSLLLPVLVTLAALVPLGAANSLPAVVGARLGLHPAAVADLQRLFPSRAAVRGSSTAIGTVFTLVSAYAWPTALQRGYEIAWGLTSKGWRGLWRPLVWLLLFVAAGALLLVLPRSGLADPWRTLLLLVFWTPLIFVWSWWTQHFLLGGAVRWRLLLPGAVAMTIGLVALRGFAAVWLSTAISHNYSRYGPLGIVFMLLTWLIALSIVMLGGPVLGAALHERRLQEAATATAAATAADRTELLAGLREKAAMIVPPPRARDAEHPVESSDGEGRRLRLTARDVRDALLGVLPTAVALLLASWVLPGLHLTAWAAVVAAVVVSVADALVRPLLRWIAGRLGAVVALLLGLAVQLVVVQAALTAAPGTYADTVGTAAATLVLVAILGAVGRWMLGAADR